MVCTMALRSRMNQRNSLRYRGSLPKDGSPFLDTEGPESTWPKLPLRPSWAPQMLNRTAAATVTLATSQQASSPDTNEKEPSDCPPRNILNQGQGTTVKSSRTLAIAVTILGATKMPRNSSIMDA